MPTVIQNKWDSGQAEDIRTTSLNQNEKCQNFDVFSEPYRLQPYSDSIADTADEAMSDLQISDVTLCVVSGNELIVGAGYESGVSSALTFYTKSNVNDAFSPQASASGNSYQKGTLITYKNQAYAVDYNGSNTYRLVRFNSAASVTNIGTISYTGTSITTPKCFVHPEDNILYVVVGNVIGKWDGSSFSTVSTILPANHEVSSLTNYGGYLAITMNALTGDQTPSCFLWGRDTSINTVQASIDLGEGYCALVENLNNNLIFVMSPQDKFLTNQQNKIIVKGYNGGSADIIKEINLSTDGQVSTYKAKKNNKLYFGVGSSDSIYVFGKNKDGQYVINQDRFITNGEQSSGNPITTSIGGISIIGDIMWIGAFTSTVGFKLMRTRLGALGESLAYTSTSTYKTTINPNMALSDRNKTKQLESIQIMYTGASSGTTVVKYSVDGSTMTTAISATNATGEYRVKAEKQNDSKPFKSGLEYQFQIECTGGSKIKSLVYKYKVLDDNI